MHKFWTILSSVVLISLLGCDELATSPAPGDAQPTTTTSSSQTTAPPDDSAATVDPADEEASSDAASEDVEREVAEVGVGKKGRGYGGGVVSEPIRDMFRTEQRMQLLQVQQAMQYYKASNGHLPKTHEIFMKDIIQANSIQLPELPEGERYVYDPEQGELMVERPKR